MINPLKVQQNEHELAMLEAQNSQLLNYLENIRSKLVSALSLVPVTAIQEVMKEEDFDVCLSRLQALFVSQGSDRYTKNTIKAVVADMQI